MHSLRSLLVLCLALCGLLPAVLPARAAGVTASSLGLSLKALSAADLDSIQAAIGQRVGVQVDGVTANSAAAKAGFQRGDIILTVAGAGVDSPAAINKVLAGQAGAVELVGAHIDNAGKATAFKRSLTVSGGGKSTGTAATSSGSHEAKPARSHGKQGEIYHHPLGFSFWYPKGWTVKEVEGALQLIPANAARTADGAAELYGITGYPLEGSGISSIDDPKVAAFLDQQMRGIFPSLQRLEGSTPFNLPATKGIRYEWEARGSKAVLRARAYGCILKNYGVVLFAAGVKDNILARDGDLDRIFTSFSASASKIDAAVVGGWSLRSTFETYNPSVYVNPSAKAHSVSESQTSLVFRGDGSATRTELSRTIAGGSGVWIDSGDQRTVKNGHWSAGNGSLYILWDDNSSDGYRYQIKRSGGSTILQLIEGRRGEHWVRR